LAIVAAVVAVAVASPSVSAQMLPQLPKPGEPSKKAKKQAQKAYMKAQRLFQRNKLLAAQKEARKAYRLVPSWTTAMALATILNDAGLHCEAFRHALIAADMAGNPQQRAQANIELSKSAATCQQGAVLIETTPKGATVEVGNVKFTAPRTVGLSPGSHVFTISAPGMQTKKATLKVQLGLFSLRTVVLAKAGPGKPDTPNIACEPPLVVRDGKCVMVETKGPDPPPDTKEAWEPSAGPWALIGVGAAMVVAGGVLYGLSVAEINGEELAAVAAGGDGKTNEQREDEYNTIVDRARTYYTTSLIVGGVGLASVIGGIIWKVMDTPPANSGSVSVGEPRLDVSPWSSPHQAGLLLRGSF